RNGDREPRSAGQTSFGGSDTTFVIDTWLGPTNPAFEWPEDSSSVLYSEAHFRSTYELRYTGDTTLAPYTFYDLATGPTYVVPFEIWNTSTGQRVGCAIYDVDQNWSYDPYDYLAIVDAPYQDLLTMSETEQPLYYSWFFSFDPVAFAPVSGDVFTFEGAPLNGPDDVFEFRTSGINSASATSELKDIRVVPNPYFVQYSALVETAEGESVLEFQKVPDVCTIRIYNLAGELVRTIEHDDVGGTARWDLLSENSRQVASGIYMFHVSSPYGDHLGRFAVVK
ncbi:MAG: hypothetical protein V3T31_03170, partial [candidate division Zixibacteria bacterium]